MSYLRTNYSTLEECLLNVDLVVEATRFEQLCLWEKWHTKFNRGPVLEGWNKTVGFLGNRTIRISCMFETVGNKFVLFYHPTSIIVDYEQIEDYIKKMCPVVDSVGFHLVENLSLNCFIGE
jgi:hypothetical protein